MKKLATKLKPDEMEEAKKRAAQFVPKPERPSVDPGPSAAARLDRLDDGLE